MINKNLFNQGDVVAVALSGGKDSVCLLHLLLSYEKELNIKVKAINVDHGIRGEESKQDSLFVKNLCQELGVPLQSLSFDCIKYSKENGLTIEEGARKLRYEMFDEIKQKTKSNKIAVGHNLNDQAETILMRVMRGTGLQGLRGIEYSRENGIIRPLLDIERSDIEKYCEVHNLNPRIDESNLQNIYTRNKIRLELIPYMMDNFNTNLIESIVRMSNSLRSDSEYIESQSESKFKDICKFTSDTVNIRIDDFSKLHNQLRRLNFQKL